MESMHGNVLVILKDRAGTIIPLFVTRHQYCRGLLLIGHELARGLASRCSAPEALHPRVGIAAPKYKRFRYKSPSGFIYGICSPNA